MADDWYDIGDNGGGFFSANDTSFFDFVVDGGVATFFSLLGLSVVEAVGDVGFCSSSAASNSSSSSSNFASSVGDSFMRDPDFSSFGASSSVSSSSPTSSTSILISLLTFTLSSSSSSSLLSS